MKGDPKKYNCSVPELSQNYWAVAFHLTRRRKS